MSTRDLQIQVKIGASWFHDTTGIADKILADLCAKTGLHPIAVLTAALVLLKQREG